jgi:SAM-dependent methyltransferase
MTKEIQRNAPPDSDEAHKVRSTPRLSNPKSNADYWDRFATLRSKQHEAIGAWAGDEWGSPERWSRLFDSMFRQHLPEDPRWALEIGPGAGKYTLLVLSEYARCNVIAADVSSAYLDILRERCATEIAAGRIFPYLIGTELDTLDKMIEGRGLQSGSLDFIYSIDAMVHVDLQFLIVYWLAATRLLKPGGKMIMTVADATRPMGFYRLIENAEKTFKYPDRNIGKFEWVSKELAEDVLGKLGFDVVEVQTPSSIRDFCFVATKARDFTPPSRPRPT